jgi:hypothetical protein
MHALFEMVSKDPETWTPIDKLGPVMRLIGEPQVGDFMAEENGVSVFLCTEVTRVRVSKLSGVNIEFEAGRGIPNWFQQAQTAILATPDGIFYAGVQLGVGDELVLDGMAIRLEKAREAAAS